MKKIAFLLAGSLALFGSQPVNATTYSPAPGTWTWAGNVVLQNGSGPVVACRMTVTATVTATAATATASFGSGGTVCGAILQNSPYTVVHSAGPPETLTLVNVLIYALGGSGCQGDLTAVFHDITDDRLVFDSATLPQIPPSVGNCTITGTLLKITPAGPITVS